uniref:Sister chromatid cohesion 1 protein 3 n=1 Tax=Anthurium amnicola TaxID=1678845 RepID=A0A1D1YJL5_9ARAE
MFYSQFILAKKGPLGTIWIAAHLERKLRKNQVADTDIGASVDSILFPDVPIALRLSSHLLVGVVRIYSRKVNYLFHDCSEALLKIKQAFRSTVVDLPPEESTAPYHSITLPETFDLDDFELPDSALLHGNFVDHHVSTREQITLQDAVDATGYSTSQFGLDERFGDGDASQIRLDLDEDVVLDTGSAAHEISKLLDSEDVEHQVSGQPETPFQNMDIDGCQNDFEEEWNAGTPKDIPVQFADDLGKPFLENVQDPREEGPSLHGYVEYPNLGEGASHCEHVKSPSAVSDDQVVSCPINQILPDLTENAQAPSTPGLMQEAIPPNVQENPTLSPSGKASPSNDMEATLLNAYQGSHMESECRGSNEKDVDPAMPTHPEILNRTCEVSAPSSVLNGPEVAVPIPHPSEHSSSPLDEPIPTCGNSLERNGDVVKDKSEPSTLGSQDLAGVADVCLDDATLTLNSGSSLRPCFSMVNQVNLTSLQDGTTELFPKGVVLGASEFPDRDEHLHFGGSSLEVQGEDIYIASVSDADKDVQLKPEHLHSQHEADCNKDDVLANVISKDVRLEINCSASSEYPEPERMLLATAGDPDVANDFGQCTNADKGVIESDGSVDRLISTLSRKRHLAESTPILLSGNLSGASQSRRNTNYVPDDDDILASILVGRTPTLKMKPTPSLPTVTVPSSKRPRLGARIGVHKRKALLDDTMVLHADAIRKQLINTEDIRRTRRKASCTRREIWMIQKCLLEEEIFSEPVLTGMSVEFVGLHSQTYEQIKVSDSQFNTNCGHVEVSNVQIPRSSECVEEGRVDEAENINTTTADKGDGERQELTVVNQSSQTMPSSLGCDSDRERDSLLDTCQLKLSSNDHQCPTISTELDTGDVVNICAQDPVLSAPCSRDECYIPTDAITVTSSINEQNGKWEMNTELPLLEDQRSLLETSQLSEELGVMNGKHEIEISNEDLLFFSEDACTAKDASLSCPQVSNIDACKTVIDDAPVYIVDNCSIEVEAALLNDLSVPEAYTVASVQDMRIPACEPINETKSTCNQFVEQFREQCADAAVEGEAVADRMNNDGESASEILLVKASQVAVSDLLQLNTEMEDNPSTVGENSSSHDVMDMEISHFDSVVARDSNVQDFCSAIGGNDTEFLNVDDEADFDEEVDDEPPNPEEAQSIENTGWSTRTRGVARYLRSLFGDESGLGRTTVAMDQLLAGKTRKEASRMFFETLVLKTKDYIHVEQETSFMNISIKPGSRLLKSEF